jgi:hypothetical protein
MVQDEKQSVWPWQHSACARHFDERQEEEANYESSGKYCQPS